MQTILGATGQIGRELAKELNTAFTQQIRLVSRHPQTINPTDTLVKADLLNTEATLKPPLLAQRIDRMTARAKIF
ncbi:MAG: hypothetical protein ACJAWI_001334 [Marinomonas primoryensis]|jgi:uncharacterized protein YbjT (DUF2867 family)